MAKKRRWSAEAKRYNSYKRAFERRVSDMIESGLTPYDAIPLTKREYHEIYTEERNDRLKEIEKGERKSIGDLNKKIISDQVYELSEEQAYAIFGYIKEKLPTTEERKAIGFSFRNINQAIAKIRQGEFVKEELGLWNIIENERGRLFHLAQADKEELLEKWKQKLIELGRTPTLKNAVAAEISQTFFGSP